MKTNNVMLQSKKSCATVADSFTYTYCISSSSCGAMHQDGSDFTKHLPAGELRQAFAPVPGYGAPKIMVDSQWLSTKTESLAIMDH